MSVAGAAASGVRVSAASGSLARILLLATASFGAVEVLIQRVGVPAMSGAAAPAGVGTAASAVGETAAAATVVLVLAAALGALAVTGWPLRAALVLAGVALATSQLVESAGLEWLTRAGFAGALLVAAYSAQGPTLARMGVLALGLGAFAGQAALTWSEMGPALRGAGEALLAVALILLGSSEAARRPTARAWIGAAIGGLLVASALIAQPGYTALAALWAWGAPLSLPPFAYMLAGAAAGLLLAAWLDDPARRHLAAALVLLAVAGLTPALVHHNLTAVLAVAVLAARRWPPEGNL